MGFCSTKSVQHPLVLHRYPLFIYDICIHLAIQRTFGLSCTYTIAFSVARAFHDTYRRRRIRRT
jgi:hypothetical protein